ncbi:MAG: M10 family metallopeptidase C-terminal domain-containing protein [Exiguobacterium profundum]|nr:MAG: M10 family metallopeptidase C-terminal domain-containing protein [Exiguobacterium profundum]
MDLIKDFTQGADRIDLPDAASYVFVGTGPFTGTADEVRFFTDVGANTTTVLVRLLGTATNAMEITLSGIFTLTAADFLF